ncbi:hypothetical protein [Rubellimicrobium aerolatum]|uniref:Uncharacterized protein n=1 Tax=Rubellimicrobium aerolatum TaxID=490979 RepID=A0ABW0SAF0_9RHOB|nr:hypothetical protein [Rubellimicrobium aerolatum]MBP1806048.1 hypothetical protein [Rubellimicrobium aerolatum]
MRTFILSGAVVALVLGTLPATAGTFDAGSRIAGLQAFDGADHDSFDRRGRGRGGDDKGRDDRGRGDKRDDSRDDDRGRRARVPGGSGCDSARDRAEHPECRG